VVRSQFAFDLVRWLKRGTLKAGEYRFDHPAAVTEVYARILRGDVYTRTVIIPEGASLLKLPPGWSKRDLARGRVSWKARQSRWAW